MKKTVLLFSIIAGLALVGAFYIKTYSQKSISKATSQVVASQNQCDPTGSLAIQLVKSYPKLLPDFFNHPETAVNKPVIEAAQLDKAKNVWVVHAYEVVHISGVEYDHTATTDWLEVDSCKKKVICSEVRSNQEAGVQKCGQ